MTQLRLALLGAGKVGREVHLRLLRDHPHARVVAVADPSPASQAAVASSQPGLAVSADAREVLARGDVDAVIIAAPTPDHARLAVDAFGAGLHVYLEKPLAATVADAQRVVEAWRASQRVGVVGFNYRFNPLIARLRELFDDGRIGRPLLIRTAFTTAAGAMPDWKRRRATGGGALLDLAAHHVDLVRHLTGAEFARVRAMTRDLNAEADVASLEAVLANGVQVQSFVSLAGTPEHEVTVFGTGGTLAVSLYRSHAVRVDEPNRSLLDRLDQWTTPGRLRHALRNRGSPWHEPSFAVALDRFIGACRDGAGQAPTLEDGLAAQAVIDAAERSVVEAGWVTLADVAPEPTAVPAMASPTVGGPTMSVILGTPDTFDTIRATVNHHRRQTVARQLELVIVCPNRGRLGPEPDALTEFASVRVVEVGEVNSVAHANAAGTRAASAPVVVFSEDHAFPEADWAERLVARHREDFAAVGPAVVNGNPRNTVSWADYLIGYGPWMDPCPPHEPGHLPGHNSSYKRGALLAYGDRLPDMLAAESVLHWDLRAKGQRLFLESAARVRHYNFALWRTWIPVQYHAGRTFAAARARHWGLLKRLAFVGGGALIPAVRLLRIAKDAFRPYRRAHRGDVIRSLPTLAVGLAVDGVGQVIGYAFGAGAANHARLRDLEYHRVKHILPSDRAAVAKLAERLPG